MVPGSEPRHRNAVNQGMKTRTTLIILVAVSLISGAAAQPLKATKVLAGAHRGGQRLQVRNCYIIKDVQVSSYGRMRKSGKNRGR